MDGAAIIDEVRARFAGAVSASHEHRGDHTVVVEREVVRDVLAFCRDAAALQFDMLMDLTAVDYSRFPGREDGARFEVVYHLYSLAHNHRLRVKVRVDEDDPVVPTAVPLWPIADWFEREVWDMFGVRFDGHPDLRRLLMYESFVGHPLRKDYPINRRQPLIGPAH
jgi:NADH-quinone oxidoreductase subunit C